MDSHIKNLVNPVTLKHSSTSRKVGTIRLPLFLAMKIAILFYFSQKLISAVIHYWHGFLTTAELLAQLKAFFSISNCYRLV